MNSLQAPSFGWGVVCFTLPVPSEESLYKRGNGCEATAASTCGELGSDIAKSRGIVISLPQHWDSVLHLWNHCTSTSRTGLQTMYLSMYSPLLSGFKAVSKALCPSFLFHCISISDHWADKGTMMRCPWRFFKMLKINIQIFTQGRKQWESQTFSIQVTGVWQQIFRLTEDFDVFPEQTYVKWITAVQLYLTEEGTWWWQYFSPLAADACGTTEIKPRQPTSF